MNIILLIRKQTVLLCAIAFFSLIPLSHAQLLFIESQTSLTETLNGVPIGDWTGGPVYRNNEELGNLIIQGPALANMVQFTDPLNSTAFSYISSAQNDGLGGFFPSQFAGDQPYDFLEGPI